MDCRPLLTERAAGDMLSPTKPFVVVDDEVLGPSPICGPASLTKLLRKKDLAAATTPIRYEAPRNGVRLGSNISSNLFSVFGSRSPYKEMSSSTGTPDDQELNSPDNGKVDDVAAKFSPVDEMTQFRPANTTQLSAASYKEDNHKLAVPSSTPRASSPSPLRPRLASWSSTLDVVTEEESSIDDVSRESQREPTCPSTHGGKLSSQQQQQQQHQPTNDTSPERAEMLLTMRSLILKQQTALKDLSLQNASYRAKLMEYQEEILALKQDALPSQERIERLVLDNEDSAAQTFLPRDGARTNQSLESHTKHSTGCNSRSSSDDEAQDESTRIKFKDMRKSYADKPKSPSLVLLDKPLSIQLSLPHSERDNGLDGETHSDSTLNGTPILPTDEAISNGQENLVTGLRVREAADSAEEDESLKTNLQEDQVTPFREATGDFVNTATVTKDMDGATSLSKVSSTVSNESGFTISSTWSSSGISTRSSKASKEEMAVYRHRLECIQKRRQQRRREMEKASIKPVVHFGTLSK
jgi:hypothetical protein